MLLQQTNFGFNAGLHAAFGTHVQRLGFSLIFFATSGRYQSNSEMKLYYSFKNLGPGLKTPEFVFSQGLVVGYGTKNYFFNPFLNSISNQTNYKNSFAYSYNVYVNKIRTSQQTGLFAMQFNAFTLVVENDILARPMLDRFRTGAFLLQYQYLDLYQAGISNTLWTGQMGRKREINHPKFHYQCYMDTTGGLYTGFSHGLLSVQFKCSLPYSQVLQLSAGIDAEQVRNAIQNKMIHDMVYIPKKWNKTKNCHIPMVDKNGGPFLYGDEQRIRKPRMYLNVFSNPSVFY